MKVAVVGVGERGAAWAARMSLMGHEVVLFDTDPGALDRALVRRDEARVFLPGMFEAALPDEGPITQAEAIPEAVAGAEWVVEALPNRLPLKRKIIQLVQAHSDGVVAGAGGCGVADLQGCASDPARIISAEGQMPLDLLPLVELGLTEVNPPDVAARARAVLEAAGMVPVESEGVAAKMMEAVGTIEETERVVLQQGVGPALMAQGDPRLLVALARAVRSGYRAEAAPLRRFEPTRPGVDVGGTPIVTLRMAVPADWTDYNGHMTEAKYLEAFGFATDRFMEAVGIDADYISENLSLFTAETHIRHLSECHVGEPFQMATRLLVAEGKKISLWHEMWVGERLAATAENMMIHVDLTTRRACPPRADIAETLAEVLDRHGKLPVPEGAGRAVGQR